MTHHHGPHHTPHDGENDDADLAELLDLDGQVLCSYWAGVLTWVRAAAAGASRILDLGAGSGVGTIALAQRFAGAEVIAVDISEQMLQRIRVKALDLGLANRIGTVQADLDAGWPAIAPVDLTWAALSLHHLTDPDRVLREILAATRPGGMMAVVEMAEPVSFLPHDLGFGQPGLEARCLDALAEEHAHSVPELGSNWSSRLAAAGFTEVRERVFPIELDPPHPPSTARYAQLWLRRLRSGLADQLAQDDLDALTTLIDGNGPESLRQREDLRVRGARTVTLARRP